MNKAINRTTVQTEENRFRIYPKGGPLFYKKPDGTFDDIDHTFNDTSSSIGAISLMDKGIVSVGKRKGNNPHKVVGIRPDSNQHLGTQQLEFSLVNVELDGQSQSFNVETDLEIKLRASKVFQLVKINKDFDNFKIEFDIHSTGLELQNNKYSQTTNLRDYGFNITNLGEIEAGNTGITLDNLFTDEDKDIPYIDSRVFKITNEYITTGEYTTEEEFGDSDLSSYTFNNDLYPNGSSVYYKDCILFIARTYNIENYEAIMVNNLCDLYGLENFDDGGSGKYLTKDNKKVIGYSSFRNIFYAFVNTTAISDEIKTLFKRKTFNDTSYLDITLSDFNTAITNKFNKNLKIDLDTNYYEPINDRFVFKINKENMYIGLPILFDEDYNIITRDTTHSLKQNDDGSYRYTKYFSTEGYLSLYSNNTKYIDSTLYVSNNEDKMIYNATADSTGQKKTTSILNTFRNDTAGTGVHSDAVTGTDVGFLSTGDRTTVTSQQFGGDKIRWFHYITHFTFDSSAISGVSDLIFKQQAGYGTDGGSHDDVDVIYLKSTSFVGGTAIDQWNDFTGFTSGWDSSDVTEYSAAITYGDYEGLTVSSMVLTNAAFNSTAETDMSDDDTFSMVAMEHSQYYSNNLDTTYGTTAAGKRVSYFSQIDHSDSALRPYLDFTGTVAGGYGEDVLGVSSAKISTINGIATANISKVNGA